MHVKSVMLAVAMTALSCDSAFAAPLGSWSFTNGLADDTGNGHTLTNGTGATVSNGAIHFTATDDTVWARTTNTIPLNGITTTVMPFFWVRCDVDKQPTDSRCLWESAYNANSFGKVGDTRFTVEGADGGYIKVDYRTNAYQSYGLQCKSRDNVLADGEWHCVAAKLGLGTCELYIDGELDSTLITNPGRASFNNFLDVTMRLARKVNAAAGDVSFAGDMDEISIHSPSPEADGIRNEFFRTISSVYHNDESKYQHLLPDGIRSKDGAVLFRVRVMGNASVTCDNAVETTGEKVFWVPDGATATLTVTSAGAVGQRVIWTNNPADASFDESGKTASFAVNAPLDLLVDAFVPTHVWTGAASEDFADAANWADATGAAVGAAPNGSDTIVFIPEGLATNPVATAAISVGDLYIGSLTNGGSATFTSSVGGDHVIAGTLAVARGGTMTHLAPGVDGKQVTVDRRLNLTVGGDMWVADGGAVDVSKRGYQAQRNNDGKYRGPGGLSTHASLSTDKAASFSCYGSIRQPTEFGAPGASWGGGSPGYGVGGDGGGAVKLVVAGTLRVQGQIISGGGNDAYCCGAGAGGSIWITAADLHGAGTITVRPGYGSTSTTKNSTMAGGGRIAFYLTEASDRSSFSGTVEAIDGTLYEEFKGDEPGRGTLTLPGGTRIRELSAKVPDALEPFKKIVIADGAGVLRCRGIVYPLATDVETGTGKLQADATSVLDIRSSAGALRKISGNVQAAALVCTNAGGAVEFAAGSAVTIDAGGSLTLLGEERGMLTMACPQTDGKWTLSIGSGVDPVIQYVAVSNSTAVTAVTDKDGADLGGNENWLFSHTTADGCKITWIGTDDNWGSASNWQDEQGQVRGITEKDAAIIPSGCTVYPQLKKHTAAWSLSVAEGAALDLNGYNLEISHDFANTGTVTCVGAEQITVVGNVTFGDSDVFVPANSTLVLAGTAAQTADLCGNALNTITFENSGELRSVMFLNGFAAQRFVCVPTNDFALVFSPEGVFGSETWQVVAASGGNLSLNSTVPGSYWHLKARPGAVFSGVTVNDSDASSGATVYSSDYEGNHNENWSHDGCIWKGMSGSWANPDNWIGGVPDATKAAVISSSAEKMPTIGEATTVGDLFIGDGAAEASLTIDAPVTVVRDFSVERLGTLTANSPIVVSNKATLATGATVTHSVVQSDTSPVKVSFEVCGDMEIQAGAKIYLMDLGNVKTGTIGGNTNHGGLGGTDGFCYGSVRQPASYGSYGYIGSSDRPGYGGGIAWLQVANTLTVNGEIRSDGYYNGGSYTGPSSGGSIWIKAGELKGSGEISADMRSITGPVRVGAGGRIAVWQTKANALSFTGLSANGGTLYVENANDESGRGELILKGTNVRQLGERVDDAGEPFGKITFTDAGGTLEMCDGVMARVAGDVQAAGCTVMSESTTNGLEILGSAAAATHLAGTFRLGTFVCTNGAAALEFAAGTTITNFSNGTLWLDGGKSVRGKMALRSSVTGQAWYLNAGTNLAGKVQNLDVSDSDASGGQTIKAKRSSSKRARNPNWEFPAGFALIIR